MTATGDHDRGCVQYTQWHMQAKAHNIALLAADKVCRRHWSVPAQTRAGRHTGNALAGRHSAAHPAVTAAHRPQLEHCALMMYHAVQCCAVLCCPQVREYTDPTCDALLPELAPEVRGHVKTLVLDLEDVLVHKEWSRAKGWQVGRQTL